MPKLNLKPNHKAIRDYYTTLQQYEKHAVTHEGAVSSPLRKYFVGLIGCVITVSLKTVEIANGLSLL